MKRNILFILLMGMSRMVRAQDFDEWFEQKKTQLNYLHQQLAAMEAYDQATEQGYGVAQQETDAIAGIQQEDVDQQSAYFSSLKTVNPVIRGSPAVRGALGVVGQIIVVAGEAEQLMAGGSDVWVGWSTTIDGFFDELLSECSADIDWLGILTTDGAAQLTDAQRITAIDGVYRRMRGRYVAAIGVRNQVGLLLNH